MPLPKTNTAVVSAVYFLMIYLVYSLVLRAANFITLVRLQDVSGGVFSPPLSLPFILGEELVIGSVLALILGLLWRYAVLRFLWLGLVGLYLVFLAFDQLAFKLFFSHVDYILYASSHDVPRLWRSVEGTFDIFFAVNLLLASTGTVALLFGYRPRFVRTLGDLLLRRPMVPLLFCAMYLAVTAVLSLAVDQHGLNRSFPVAYGLSYLQVRAEREEIDRALAAKKSESGTAAPRAAKQADVVQKSADVRLEEPEKRTGSKKLNVVMYLMESASFRETSLSPTNPFDTTPFLKALAPKSLVFNNYYTGFAASTRSVFSALTGLYPYVDSSADVTKYSRLNVPNLVNILHGEGYATGFFSSSDTLFDSLDTFLTNLKYDTYIDKNLVPKKLLSNVSAGAWGVDEEIVIDRALEWIARVKDSGKPFLVNYNAVYPHHPFRLPKQHRHLYQMEWGKEELKSRYRASLNYADLSVKRFYDGLKRLDVLKNTLFIVTSDHGEAFGDVHKKNLIHAEYCYNEDHQIFLMLHNPATLGPPSKNPRLGTHADLLPTLLNILNIEQELEIDGQSLVSSDYSEPIIYCCSRRHLGLREGKFKFVTPKEGGKSQLFDLSVDPEEQNNIARENRELVEKYKKMAREWRISVIGAYRDRVAKAGLSKKEINKLANKSRGEIFAGARARLDGASICLSSNRASCAASGQSPSFAKERSLTVQARVIKPGNVALQVDLYSPQGVKLTKQKTAHKDITDQITTDLSASLFQETGKYRARILLLSSHAVHDSTMRYFNIHE